MSSHLIACRNRYVCLLFGALVSLLGWTFVTSIINNESFDALFSSSRMLLEATIAFSLVKLFNLNKEFVVGLIIKIGVINSIFVLIEISESSQLINLGVSRYFHDFWGIYEELTRKPGIFNTYLTSSFLSLISLTLLFKFKPRFWILFSLLNIAASFFGARTLLPIILIFLLLLVIKYKKLSVAFILFVLLSAFLNFGDLIESNLISIHLNERLKPFFDALLSVDSEVDYSAKDLILSYRMPRDFVELFFGNGFPRYHENGGQDPALTRWLFQSGFFALGLIVIINFVIVFKLISMCGWYGFIFSFGALALMFKSEQLTAAGTFMFLVLLLNAEDENKFHANGAIH